MQEREGERVPVGFLQACVCTWSRFSSPSPFSLLAPDKAALTLLGADNSLMILGDLEVRWGHALSTEESPQVGASVQVPPVLSHGDTMGDGGPGDGEKCPYFSFMKGPDVSVKSWLPGVTGKGQRLGPGRLSLGLCSFHLFFSLWEDT